jgi:Tfp pilus assembly protein PilN
MNEIDLLPERIRTKRRRLARLKIQIYMLIFAAMGLTLLGYARYGHIERAKADLTVLRDRADNGRQQLETLTKLQSQQGELLIKKRIDDTLGSRANTLEVLAELGRLLPESMAVTNLSIESTVLSPSAAAKATDPDYKPASASGAGAAKVNRVTIVLTGLAPNDVDVANFIGMLSSSPLFEDVNMGYAKNTTYRGRSAREFQASFHVVR